jgi:hypothetical protein
MSEVFDKAVKKGLQSLEEIPSPFEVARKLGLNIPTGEDIEDILSIIGPQADIKAMVKESSRVVPALKKGDIPEAISSLGLAALAPLMIGIPGTVSGIRKGSEGLASLGETRKIKDTLLKEVERKPDFKGHAEDVYWTKDPITLKHIFNPDEDYAASIVATARHGPFETVDPVSPRILKSTKKQIYEATQKALENFPDKIKVYRMAEKDAPFNLEGVDSFSLDPKFSGSSLPWAVEKPFGPLKKNYQLTEYLVDKKDILAAPNALWKGSGVFDEQEVILRTAKLKGSGGLSSLGEK